MNCRSCSDHYPMQAGFLGQFYCGQLACQKQKLFDQMQRVICNMRPGVDSLILERGTLYLRTPMLNLPLLQGVK